MIFRAVTSQGDRRSIEILIGTVHGSDEWVELQKKDVAEYRSTIDNKTSAPPAPIPPPPGQPADTLPEHKTRKPRQYQDPNPELLKDPDALLGRFRAAEALGVHVRTIDRYVSGEKLTPVGHGSRKRFKAKDLRKFRDQRSLDKRDKK